MRTFQTLRLLLAGLAWMATSAGWAQSKSPPDYEVKAAFLANFPKYVEWSAEAPADTNSPTVVACLGESKVSEALRKVIQSRPPNAGAIVAKVITAEAESADCHILFIGGAERRRLPAVLARLKGASVLVVGESDDFLDKGGTINLALRDRRVRVEVNLHAARQANLIINSKLLGVADVVKGKAN